MRETGELRLRFVRQHGEPHRHGADREAARDENEPSLPSP